MLNNSVIFIIGNKNQSSIKCQYPSLFRSIRGCHNPQEYKDKPFEIRKLLLQIFLNKIVKENSEGKIAVLIICGHGCNSKDGLKISFAHDNQDKTSLVIDSKIISEEIHKMNKDGFKCCGLIETCYSGKFDTSCFLSCITATDEKTSGNYGLLFETFDQVLQKSDKTYNLKQIFDESYDKKSPVYLKRFKKFTYNGVEMSIFDTSNCESGIGMTENTSQYFSQNKTILELGITRYR